MSEIVNNIEVEGDAIVTDSTPDTSYTIADYLLGCVDIDVPRETIVRICLDRDIDICENAADIDKNVRDLCKADLFVWMVTGVSRRGTVTDTDNGWTHSDGGFTFTDEDKARFLSMANKIYDDNGEDTIGRTKAKVFSYGIKRSNVSPDGTRLPYIFGK